MGTKKYGLDKQGITGAKNIYWDLNASRLYEEAIRRNEGIITAGGTLVANTGKYTGRSPDDKFVVEGPVAKEKVWWGKVNKPISSEKFDQLYRKMMDFVKGRDLFVQDCTVGAKEHASLPIRVITEYAWHSLFARNMFVTIQDQNELDNHNPEYVVIDIPSFKANPAEDGTNSEAFILPNFDKKMILIGGTSYAGEIKKSIFTLLNYLLPQKGILSMHCSANLGSNGDTAVFFGLSGTGKTTLSADPDRFLIGDDEHGWSDKGVFNFEGGCYAKMIRLSKEAEPEIYATTERFGTVLENVTTDPVSRKIDLDDASVTENTRGSYPLDFIPNIAKSRQGGHPQNIIMLTCDAFGVLPPVSELTPAQAMYHFLSGYTAKVAGTERGIKEPQATFSACFGGPFMALHPGVYAKLLGEKIASSKAKCWLVNTGWSGGAYGVGSRISIANSRAIIKAILTGQLANVSSREDATFKFKVPTSCPGISSPHILDPRNTWKVASEFDSKAKHLAGLFQNNFKQYEAGVTEEIRKAGPVV